MLIAVDSAPSKEGSPDSTVFVRSAVVLVFSSDIRFLSDRISALSFSASLLILMNCVRFCMRFCWRSVAARALSLPSDSSNSRMPSSSTSARAAATSRRPRQQSLNTVERVGRDEHWSALSLGSRRAFISRGGGSLAPLEGGGPRETFRSPSPLDRDLSRI